MVWSRYFWKRFKLSLTSEQGGGNAAKRSRLSKVLPTDRISFAKQLEIIRAYPTAWEKNGKAAVSNQEVGDLVGMAGATISQANAFLADVGLISRAEAGKYLPSSELISFYNAYQFSPDRAWPKLAPLFLKSWFGHELVHRLKLRDLRDEDAIHFLAEAATAEPQHKAQLRMAIDFLAVVGLLIKQGDELKKANPDGEEKDQAPPEEKEAAKSKDEFGFVPGEMFVLPLSGSTGQKFWIKSPPEISRKDLERIKKWLEVQLVIKEDVNDLI